MAETSLAAVAGHLGAVHVNGFWGEDFWRLHLNFSP
jgi:hypothetical protein